MSIVDAHTHLGEFPVFGESLSAEKLLGIMDEYGIAHAVVSALPNKLTREAVEEFPDRLSGLVGSTPSTWRRSA